MRGAGLRATPLRGLSGSVRQIRRIFADYTPLVEPLSLDEAYLDVTENLRGIPTASATAKDIRARILTETGLTASAGISYNKFLAKLASDHRKPNGQFVITPEMGPGFIEDLPVGKFHGVGPVTADKMKALGIHTGADLRDKSLAFLQQHFGRSGAYAPSRGARMIASSCRTGRASHRAPRPRSPRTSRRRPRSRPVSEPWRTTSGAGAKGIRCLDRR